MAVHAFAQAELAVLRDEARLVVLGDEVVQVVVGFEDDVAAAPAVAAAGPALGPILLALEGDAPFAAVAGPRVDFDFVNEHGEDGERSGGALEWRSVGAAVQRCNNRITPSFHYSNTPSLRSLLNKNGEADASPRRVVRAA